MKLDQVVNDVVIKRSCDVSPDADAKARGESKTINIEVEFNEVPLQGVFYKAASGAIITWQNGWARKHYGELKNNQVVKIQFAAPASMQVAPEVAVASKLAAMTASEQEAYIANLLAEAKKAQK